MNDNGSDRLAAIEAALTAAHRAVQGVQAALAEVSVAIFDARMAVLYDRMDEVVRELRTQSHKAA